MSRQRQRSFVSKWAKGRSGTVTEPARIHYCIANKLRETVWMTRYHPDHTWHLSPPLTSRPNTNAAFMVLISTSVYQWLNPPTSVTRRASLSCSLGCLETAARSVRAALIWFSFRLRRQVKAFQKLFSSLIMWRMSLDADVRGDEHSCLARSSSSLVVRTVCEIQTQRKQMWLEVAWKTAAGGSRRTCLTEVG